MIKKLLRLSIAFIFVSWYGFADDYRRISLIVVKNTQAHEPRELSFMYVPYAVLKKESRPNRDPLIEEVQLVSDHEYTAACIPHELIDQTELNCMNISTISRLEHQGKSWEGLKDFLKSSQFGKQLVGIKTNNNQLYLQCAPINSAYIEDTAHHTYKKTRIWSRGGTPIKTELKAYVVSFSLLGLTEAKLDGVAGLLTPRGEQKIAHELGTTSFKVGQITLRGMFGESTLGAKGTFGVAVSPLQHMIIEEAAQHDSFDIVLNQDELNAFKNSTPPPHKSTLFIPADHLLVMQTLDDSKLRRTTLNVSNFLRLLPHTDLFQAYKQLWLEAIEQVGIVMHQTLGQLSTQASGTTRDILRNIVISSLIEIGYQFSMPGWTRYLWADESLDLNECKVPESLAKALPLNTVLVFLSHPLLLDKTHALLKVVGYTESEAWVINPDLSHRISRDQDGDTITIVDPRILKMRSTWVPPQKTVTTKTELTINQANHNEALLEFILHDVEFNLFYVTNAIFSLYLYLAQADRLDLVKTWGTLLALFQNSSMDRLKKTIDPYYTSANLKNVISIISSEAHLELDRFGDLPVNPLIQRIKQLKILLQHNDLEQYKTLLKQTTQIKDLDDIWGAILKLIEEFEQY